jgi:hypothetical protein
MKSKADACIQGCSEATDAPSRAGDGWRNQGRKSIHTRRSTESGEVGLHAPCRSWMGSHHAGEWGESQEHARTRPCARTACRNPKELHRGDRVGKFTWAKQDAPEHSG